MNNLTLFILGLVLINIPSCFSECFSESLTPSYPCCKGNKVVYTDDNGDWGVENNKWCGIGNGPFDDLDDSCFSVPLGYRCCEKCNVVFTDDSGDWGVEKNKWCGIKYSCASHVEEPVPVVQDLDFSFLKMENNKKNMLYSPLSIKYALKMLEEGANGKTLTEIKNTIGNSTLTKYESIDKILSLANGLYIRDTYYKNVREEYINTLKEKYDAEVIEDEFKDAKNANQWIEDKTLGIIKDMLKDKTVQNSVMLLINALAMDMEWADSFNSQSTSGEKFYLDNGEEMEATTMYHKYYDKELSYYQDDDITAVTLDLKEYEKTQFEFMAIMPNENLSGYVKNVTTEQICEIDEKLISASDVKDGVTLEIPKFKFSYDLNLKDDLIDLGINDAFDADKANFTKMANSEDPNKKLFVSDALHKADIEFSEDGVKAAAVTVFVMANGATLSMPTYPVHLYINKPFMFVIRDKNTKDIWFTGTVYEPNSWADDKKDYEPKHEDPKPNRTCFSVALGYPCCNSCNEVYSDSDGSWGIENDDWCGIRYSCFSRVDIEEPVVIEDPNVIEDPVPVVQDDDDSELDFSFLKMENNKQNMIYSPLSIKYALKMLEEGADGKTLDEIKNAIGNSTLPKYENIDKILSLANGIFIKDTYYEYVKEKYINILKEKYNAEVKEDEFIDAKNANQWIEDKTLGIIKNMLKDDAVQSSVMLLINALAIDMEWADPFDCQYTDGEKFYLDNGEVMEATTMFNEFHNKLLSYYQDDEITAITMDLKEYNEIQFEFMAIMPEENLSGYVENVTKKQIHEIDEKLIPSSEVRYGIEFEIPKFKFSYDLKFKDDLINLGINNAFDAVKAEFTKISDPEDPNKKLFVSDALHKADIGFSEDGIKAAAVTVFEMTYGAGMSNPTYPLYISINKPFMFIIRDKSTKDIWFTGTVYEPNSWEDDEEEYKPEYIDLDFDFGSL